MPEELDLSTEEEALLDAVCDRRAKRKSAEKQSQFSIADPPNRDRATSQPAKAKDSASAAAPALAGEIRRRLQLLKKN